MSYDKWIVRKLGEITINHDKKRIPLSTMERTSRKGKYPYYGAQGIIDYIDDYIFEGRYLLIAEDGANLQTRNQDIALLTSLIDKFWVNNHAHILSSNELSDIRYIMYYLNYYDISGYITGSAQPKLNQSNLNNIEIKLPSLQEQKAIANILSSLDDKIELNNKINKNLEELAQTVYKRWFVDFEFPNEDGQPYKSSGGEMVESELGLIPKAWTIKEQGEYFPVITGKKNANIATSDGKYKFFTCSQEVYLTDSYSFEGDAILVAGNGDFNVKYYSGKFEAYQRTYVLIPQNNKLSGILYFAIQHNLNDITSGSRGSVISFITKGHIENFKVVFPNTTKLEELGIIFRNILISIARNNEENDRLSKLRDKLLPKLMNGEIEVPIEE